MKNQVKKPNNSRFFSTLAKGLFLNSFIGFFALVVAAIFGGPYMAIEKPTAQILFFLLLAAYLFIFFWEAITLLFLRTNKDLVVGVYKYLRQPTYSAVVFILNPAFAILFRSWLLGISVCFAFFLWRSLTRNREEKLVEIFGDEYKRYSRTTGLFFPKLLNISKPAFFGAIALAVFAVSLLIFDFPVFYSQGIEWQTETQTQPPAGDTIASDTILNQATLPKNDQVAVRPRPQYDITNSIVIEKIGINAPLVIAASAEKKDLDSALNQGVVIYPGSKMPGEQGEVFMSGHSSTYFWNKTKYGQVFAKLDKLAAGDIITIYFEKYKYDYRVTEKSIVAPDKAVLDPLADSKTLTLMTCWPVGTDKNRLIVKAVQID